MGTAAWKTNPTILHEFSALKDDVRLRSELREGSKLVPLADARITEIRQSLTTEWLRVNLECSEDEFNRMLDVELYGEKDVSDNLQRLRDIYNDGVLYNHNLGNFRR